MSTEKITNKLPYRPIRSQSAEGMARRLGCRRSFYSSNITVTEHSTGTLLLHREKVTALEQCGRKRNGVPSRGQAIVSQFIEQYIFLTVLFSAAPKDVVEPTKWVIQTTLRKSILDTMLQKRILDDTIAVSYLVGVVQMNRAFPHEMVTEVASSLAEELGVAAKFRIALTDSAQRGTHVHAVENDEQVAGLEEGEE